MTRLLVSELRWQRVENADTRKANALDPGAVLHWRGIRIVVENPVGHTRSGFDSDGTPWSITMKHHYGYIPEAQGVDGDRLDVYLGPQLSADKVYVIHQKDPVTGKVDEDKVMLGFGSAAAAKAGFRAHYDRPGFFGGIETMTLEEFKRTRLGHGNHNGAAEAAPAELEKGGPGSGHHGHLGRPGKVGGSMPGALLSWVRSAQAGQSAESYMLGRVPKKAANAIQSATGRNVDGYEVVLPPELAPCVQAARTGCKTA